MHSHERSNGPPRERRRWPRAEVPAIAHLIRRERWLGNYAVDDLSAGGAALIGAPRLEAGDEVDVILHVYGETPVALSARVARAPAGGTVALAFSRASPQLEERLNATVLAYRERAETAALTGVADGPAGAADDPAGAEPTAVVVDDQPEVSAALARELEALGVRAIRAQSPLEAIEAIEDNAPAIRFVLVDLALGRADGTDLLAWVADEHPGVRRVLMSGVLEPKALSDALMRRKVHAILRKPWTRYQLSQTLYGDQASAEASA